MCLVGWHLQSTQGSGWGTQTSTGEILPLRGDQTQVQALVSAVWDLGTLMFRLTSHGTRPAAKITGASEHQLTEHQSGCKQKPSVA